MSKHQVISAEDFLKVLSKSRKGRTLRVFAAELGVAYQFLGQVFAGKCHPGPTIAKKLGYEQVFAYRRSARSKAKSRKPRNSKQMHVSEDARLAQAIEV
jgi:hypothetical protein